MKALIFPDKYSVDDIERVLQRADIKGTTWIDVPKAIGSCRLHGEGPQCCIVWRA